MLKRAFHNAHRAVTDAVRPYGITPTQMGALRRLIQEPGLSGADLARRLLVTPQAAQLALAALEKQGLVARTPDPQHGRIVRTTVTKEGRRIIKACTSRAYAAEDDFLSVIEPKERKALIDHLQKLAHTGPSKGDHLKDL